MIWWMTNPSRAKSETASIAELFENDSSLLNPIWRFEEGLQLCLDFDIHHRGEDVSLTLKYPSTFPDTPPIVVPRDGRSLSSHQYLGGELCLEYRPDNWDYAYTGAMMVISAQKLLVEERPEEGGRGVVPTAHVASLGRDLRGTTCRFLMSTDLVDALVSLPLNEVANLKTWETSESKIYVGSVVTVISGDAEVWTTKTPRPKATITDGFAFRTDRDLSSYRGRNASFFEEISDGIPELAAALPVDDFQSFLLLGNEVEWIVLFLARYGGKPLVISYTVIHEQSSVSRISDTEATALSARRVAIVGCGSVGSKIATMLARSGVSKFTLVDDDVLLFGNLVRNDLDVTDVGRHKVDAVAERIERLVANADIICRKIALGSQEASSSMESVLEAIGACDLIIDATADATAFNLLASAARRNRKPMIWCEVLVFRH
jgi:hypothetical protein